MSRPSAVRLIAIGVTAGAAGGLFGVGGGIVMVPLLVLACGFEQHRAHVVSLSAGIVLGVAGAATYATEGSVDVGIAAALAAGSIVGAPIGARIMTRTPEGWLRAAFGLLLIVVAIVLVLR